jgi:hypothetical protein
LGSGRWRGCPTTICPPGVTPHGEPLPADKQIDACNKVLTLKVFSGEKLATIYFWRAVGWNK